MLEPEVAGGHGSHTIYKDVVSHSSCNSDNVEYLHYELDGWLGDDILESTPAFIVTEKMKNELEASIFYSDCVFEDCLVTTSDNFVEIYPNAVLPKFYRLVPKGSVVLNDSVVLTWSGHHFNLSDKCELVVSHQALLFLKQMSIDYCDYCELNCV